MAIKFERKMRYEPRGVTNHRLASARSKFKREQAKLPLFADEIAESQPSPEEYILSNDNAMIRWESFDRQRVANNWRRGRKMLRSMPDDVKKMAIEKWNSFRWLPKTASYFVDMFYSYFREYYIEENHDSTINP